MGRHVVLPLSCECGHHRPTGAGYRQAREVPRGAPQGRSSRLPSPQESCSSLRHYLVSVLGPYVANVTAAARACSLEQCHGHGRCVRRQPRELSILLHLGAGSWAPFRCHCYRGWAGQDCEQPEPQSPTACPASTHGLYGHRSPQVPDTCPRRSSWG